MKKIQIKNYTFAALCLLMLTTACNKETSEEDSKTINATEMLTFTAVEEDFGSNEEIGTRAQQTPQIQKDTVQIADDLDAVVNIQKETTPKTRATKQLEGYYTLLVYKDDGTLLPQYLNGEFKDNKFKPNAPLHLESDKQYIFVLQPSTDILGSDGTHRYIEYKFPFLLTGNETLGVAKATISGKKQEIHITMKHIVSRIRIRLKAYNPINNAIGYYASDLNNDMTIRANFDPISSSHSNEPKFSVGKTGSYSNFLSGSVDAPELKRQNGTYIYAYNTKDEQMNTYYILPQTNLSTVKLNMSANTIYGKYRGLISIPLTKSTFVTQPNGSYTVTIEFKYTGFKYLFNDGTTGTKKDNPSKWDIGLVIKENNGTPKSGLAILYKARIYGPTWVQNSGSPAWGEYNNNISATSNTTTALNKTESGYDITYNPTYGPYGKSYTDPSYISANTYRIFGAAKSLQSILGLTPSATNVGEPFIPTLSEWALAIKRLNPDYNGGSIGAHFYYPLFRVAFDNFIEDYFTDNLWTSSHGPNNNGYYIRFNAFNHLAPQNNGAINFTMGGEYTPGGQQASGKAIAFIHF